MLPKCTVWSFPLACRLQDLGEIPGASRTLFGCLRNSAGHQGDTVFGELDSVNCSRAFGELGAVRSSQFARGQVRSGRSKGTTWLAKSGEASSGHTSGHLK